jgi:hypothetical protein
MRPERCSITDNDLQGAVVDLAGWSTISTSAFRKQMPPGTVSWASLDCQKSLSPHTVIVNWIGVAVGFATSSRTSNRSPRCTRSWFASALIVTASGSAAAIDDAESASPAMIEHTWVALAIDGRHDRSFVLYMPRLNVRAHARIHRASASNGLRPGSRQRIDRAM